MFDLNIAPELKRALIILATFCLGVGGFFFLNSRPAATLQSAPEILQEITPSYAESTTSTVIVNVAGEQFEIANTKISVLWPDRYQGSFESLPGDGSAINNSSIALLIKSTNLSIFAAGDLEPPVQELLTTNPLLAPVDIYKVSHHGSAYQYLPMLDKINPTVALISVGAENNYGHPSQDLIGEFGKRRIKVVRTDKSGGIAISAPNKIRVTGNDWWRIRWG